MFLLSLQAACAKDEVTTCHLLVVEADRSTVQQAALGTAASDDTVDTVEATVKKGANVIIGDQPRLVDQV